MPATVERHCDWCKEPFTARTADVKRGWARFCSKSCKATQQESRNASHRSIGNKKAVKRTREKWEIDEDAHEIALCESTTTHGQDGTGGW